MKILFDFGDFPESASDILLEIIQEQKDERRGFMRFCKGFEVIKPGHVFEIEAGVIKMNTETLGMGKL